MGAQAIWLQRICLRAAHPFALALSVRGSHVLETMVDMSNLTRQKVFEDTKWLFYMLCSGQGIGSMSPLCLDDTKELCLHSQAGTADMVGDQGCVHTFSTCIC